MNSRVVLVVFLLAVTTASLSGQVAVRPEEEFANAADLAKRFFAVGEYDAALGYYEKADSLFPDQPAVLYNTALVLVRLARFDDAQQRLERYRLLHPSGKEIEQVRSLQRDINFAIEFRQKGKQQSEYRAAFSRGRFLYQSGQHREALDAFREAERLFPNDPPLLINEAILYEEAGNLERAAELYKRYMESGTGNRAEYEPKVFRLERDIVDSRTKMMCPFCGQKLQPGSRWCHRCWHGPYDDASGALSARACASGVTVTRTLHDAASKVRATEQLPCLFPGKSVSDFFHYHPNKRSAIRAARVNEGWSYAANEAIEARQANDKTELRLVQGEYLAAVDDVRTGERFRFAAHASADAIWLLDSEPFTTADQQFTKSYTYDADGRLSREQVAYVSVRGGHLVKYDVVYANGENAATSATIKGGYDGYRAEGVPQVRWEVSIARTFDTAGRVTREELQVRSFQKTFTAKPWGGVSRELRQIYQPLKVNRPIDLRPTGDLIGTVGAGKLSEAIDLRPLYTFSPAMAMILPDGVTHVTVDYSYR